VDLFVVAGAHSGVGKTSVACGLMAALRRRGLAVQPFKAGPDFIDPQHHARAAGRAPHNLDGWMLSREANLELFARHAAGADVAVVEGMMGLFDGADPRDDRGSTAELARWIDAPVLLVIDASAMARSAAALVHGYATFDERLELAGVVANRVGSEGHAGLIEQALEGRAPLIGWLPADERFAVGERHLGLHLPEPANAGVLEQLADAVERNFDLDRLLAACDRPSPSPPPAVPASAAGAVRIGVARDAAFSFYYEDNLALLAAAGAELVEFSPLADEPPAALDGLYLGGGYPELHAATLERNTSMRAAVRALADEGRPVYAECGGLVYLGEALTVDGTPHEMCGALPLSTEFPGQLELGYCEVETTRDSILGEGHSARGHRFHTCTVTAAADLPQPYRDDDGFALGSVQASWVHLHFRSCPELASAFVARCRDAAR
jgi:cobyrinic acid a,c-diamide synthase